ncbi:MAG TPA: hypothetical protein PKD00_00245 [Burkholderiales bacterium]|nr:hypothetical protein [Burkholderiales bacterium]
MVTKLVNLDKAVLDSFIDICLKNYLTVKDSFTTLDFKNYFRENNRFINISQDNISQFLMRNHKNYDLFFTDNGTYRTYYVQKEPLYFSKSKGTIKISSMESTHLMRAIAKEVSNTDKSDLFLMLKSRDLPLFELLKEYISRNDSK